MKRKFLLVLTCTSLGLAEIASASFSVRIVAKQPYPTEHYDSTGQAVQDSLARFYPARMTVFRNGSESLTRDDTTDSSGAAVFTFESWADLTSVDSTTIQRMMVEFPNTGALSSAFGQVTLAPVKFDSLGFHVEEIELVLPADIVSSDPFTIGNPNGYNVCNFVVLNDMHITQNDDWNSGDTVKDY